VSGLRAEELLGVIVRRSAAWVGGVGALCVLGYLVFAGTDAALAALLGVLMVAVFFGVDLVVLRLTKRSPGAVTAAALMGEYVLKVVVLAAVLWGLATSTDLDLQATAVTVVVMTVVAAVAVTVAAMRTRSFTFDFPSGSEKSSKAE
jgi:hypothetical protein